MIDEIQVTDLALICEASLSPCSGLTVLTGETGAGKTALLSAMKMLMGERSDKTMVREGAEQLVVSGRFFLSAQEGASDSDLEESAVVRRVSAEGKSRVTLDGAISSAKELGTVVAPTIDLCGQHEHQQLMKPAFHRAMLDAWAQEAITVPLESYRRAFAEAKEAAEALKRVQEAGFSSSQKLEEARFVLRRIDEVDPQMGEYEDLKEALRLAEHSETLVRAANEAYESLSGEGCTLDSLNEAIVALDRAASLDETLAKQAKALREACFIVEDVSAEARSYRDRVEFDAEELAAWQERMSALQGLLRAYGPTMEEVLACRERSRELVSSVDDSERCEREAQQRVAEAEEALAGVAATLAAVRMDAAPAFSRDVTEQMGRLHMGGAELVCEVKELPRSKWTADGPVSVEFLFRSGSGMQPRSLARIASGGEASRVMLAIKVVLGASDQVDTLVFDEVDAGVGGATAVSLAAVLSDLASTHQVIVVTHLAQVAVAAQRHYVVRKSGEERPETTLFQVEGDDRVREIARMLSGDFTDASLAHAREMLEGAASQS